MGKHSSCGGDTGGTHRKLRVHSTSGDCTQGGHTAHRLDTQHGGQHRKWGNTAHMGDTTSGGHRKMGDTAHEGPANWDTARASDTTHSGEHHTGCHTTHGATQQTGCTANWLGTAHGEHITRWDTKLGTQHSRGGHSTLWGDTAQGSYTAHFWETQHKGGSHSTRWGHHTACHTTHGATQQTGCTAIWLGTAHGGTHYKVGHKVGDTTLKGGHSTLWGDSTGGVHSTLLGDTAQGGFTQLTGGDTMHTGETYSALVEA